MIATTRRTMLATLAAGLAWSGAARAQPQQEPVRIGELNSYSGFSAFTVPYRNGWQLAVDEINARGGVLNGRRIEVISRDDGARTGDATRVAEELLTREKVSFLFGSFLSNVGVAMADFANQRKVLYIAAEPLTDAITMAQGNRYTFRVRPNNFMQVGMLIERAKASGVKRWAIVAPNYEYGQSAAGVFKQLLGRIPGAEVVAEQYPALNKIEAGATVAALDQARPDGIFNVLFGADLTALVREGNTRGLFERRTVLSLLTGEPEWYLPLKDEAPEGWIVTGYPWEQIQDPKHKAFVDAYRAKFNDTPRLGSLLGYVVMGMIRDTIERAGSAETEALIKALEDAKFDTVIGPVAMRGVDNQATMGAWVGTMTQVKGQGAMKDWTYLDGASFMHPPEEVRAVRKD